MRDGTERSVGPLAYAAPVRRRGKWLAVMAFILSLIAFPCGVLLTIEMEASSPRSSTLAEMMGFGLFVGIAAAALIVGVIVIFMRRTASGFLVLAWLGVAISGLLLIVFGLPVLRHDILRWITG